MDVIILAGGYGTRLRHIVSDVQKVMAPVNSRPFLTYLLDYLTGQGFGRFILAVSYLSESIKNVIGEEYCGAEIVYSVEKTPLGTGGAIKQAMSFADGEYVLVVNGDTFFEADYNAMLGLSLEKKADITVGVKKMRDFSRYGTVETSDSGLITAFNEKKYCAEGLINAGSYIIRRDVLCGSPEGGFSFEKEILEKCEKRTFAFESRGFFIDIGIPADYYDAMTLVPLRTGHTSFRAAFLDRDGVINREKHHLFRTEDFEFIPGSVAAMRLLREKGYLIIVITNQAGVAKGLYDETDVEKLHKFMLEQIGDEARIDGIYYCPFHPEATVERYRLDSYDRKPSPGMIFRAREDFALMGAEIDLSASILVGDTPRDIETGLNAGIGRNYLVRSGHAFLPADEKTASGVFDSLAEVSENIN